VVSYSAFFLAVLSILLMGGSVVAARSNAWIAWAISLLNFACATILVLLPGLLEHAGGYMAIYVSATLVFSIACLVIAVWPPQPQPMRRVAPVRLQHPAVDPPSDHDLQTAINPVGWLNTRWLSPGRDHNCKPEGSNRRPEARSA